MVETEFVDVSLVSFRWFRWFRFDVSGFSTCPKISIVLFAYCWGTIRP